MKVNYIFIYTKEAKLGQNQMELFVKKSPTYDCLDLMKEEARSKLNKTEEVNQKLFMHWNSGFCKQSQRSHVHTDEDCANCLKGEKCRYDKCRDNNGQTWTDKGRQGLTGTDKDYQE